ncbi:hypothetical protein ABZ832_28460 [Streptantibioticus parmotrematis]|uniref:hypothetical protein n=1 Tax=Streptantibioticus parmotrematis TaxID=2873249 RepID=UPI0033ECFE6B
MIAFTKCQQESAGIMRARLDDEDFGLRMQRTSRAWGIDHGSFLRQVEGIIAIALFRVGHEDESKTPACAVEAALELLREWDLVRLFAGLPADLGNATVLVRSLRLLSFGLTPATALRWARLQQTAVNVLDTGIVFLDPEPTSGEAETTYGQLVVPDEPT